MNDAALNSRSRRLRPILYSQLTQNILHMILDCMLRNAQCIRDLLVCQPLHDELKHLHLASAQIGTRHLRR